MAEIIIPAGKINLKDITADAVPADLCTISAAVQGVTRVNYPGIPEPKTNCRNCGAPLDSNKNCPYCGTKHQVHSGISMNADGISMWVG